MPQSNSENTEKGRSFQRAAAQLLKVYFGAEFLLEQPIPIGTPAKPHRFDLVSTDSKFVGESKNFCWTEGGNVPSAKMGFVNEAVFYLSHLPRDVTRFVVLRRDCHSTRGSLAEYYVRTNAHLLAGVRILEANLDQGTIREVTTPAPGFT